MTADRTVVLDLGGVVIRWDPVPAIAAAVGEERARRFVSGEVFDFAGWNAAQDAGRAFEAAEPAGMETHPHLAEEIRAYRPNFARSLVGLVPGTSELMGELRTQGVRLVALTNWSAETFHHAPALYPDVFALLDDVVVSGAERLAKPDPAIFARLGERLGHSVDGVPFIDDSAANVAAAAACGMDAIRFTGADLLRTELANRGLLG